MGSVPPLTTDAEAKRKAAGWVFGGIALLGFGVLGVFFLPPLVRVAQARGWTETPCTILTSELEVHERKRVRGGATTFSISITYEYEVAGRKYSSSQFSFESWSSSIGQDDMREVVNRLPPGKRTVCYVNPGDPAQAVIKRTLGLTYLAAIVPLAIAIIGLVGWVRWYRRGVDPTVDSGERSTPK